jgi:hypothetical protein
MTTDPDAAPSAPPDSHLGCRPFLDRNHGRCPILDHNRGQHHPLSATDHEHHRLSPRPSALSAAFCNCVVIPLAGGWRRYAKTPRSTTSSPLVPASPIACCSGECASEANSGSQMYAKPPYTVENYLTFVVGGIHEERKH